MTAMSAEKLREPELLYVPPDYDDAAYRAVLEGLSPESARQFAAETMAAIQQAQREGDLSPINLTIETWFRTMLFTTRPEFGKRWREMQKIDGPRLSSADIRRRRDRRTA